MTLRLYLLLLTASTVSSFAPRPLFVGTKSATSFSLGTAASSSKQSSTALDAFKKVFVAGGSRGVGRLVVEKLSAQEGMEVVALVRDPAVAEELNQMPGVKAIVGDAFQQKDVENAMDGCDSAITTLGGSSAAPDGNSQRVDYEGNNNVIESAGILGVTRIILVTSIGCGNSKEAAPPSVFEVLKDVLASKEK